MILILRESDASERWTYNGWFLQPLWDRRGALVFDGVELIDYDREHTRRWSFDGSLITERTEASPLWLLEDGVLSRPEGHPPDAWRWDGLRLSQVSEAKPDVWRATEEVPLLVIAFAASLL